MPTSGFTILVLIAVCAETAQASNHTVAIPPLHFVAVGPLSTCGDIAYNMTVIDGVGIEFLVVDDAGLQACKTALSISGSFNASQEAVISRHLDKKFAANVVADWDGDIHIVIDNTYLMIDNTYLMTQKTEIIHVSAVISKPLKISDWAHWGVAWLISCTSPAAPGALRILGDAVRGALGLHVLAWK